MSSRKITGSTADPEAVAILALQFLAADPERLGRFLALTGLGPETLRGAAAEPGFLASVLAHIGGHEPTLIAFAAFAELPPEAVSHALARLSGPPVG